MRTTSLLFLTIAALTTVACGGSGGSGGSGDTATTGTSGTGGTAATSTSSGMSTTTGTGGDATTTTSSTSSGSGTGGAGGGSACSGFIDVSEDGGATQHFASICEGTWGSSETMTAVGYHFSGGAAPGADHLEIIGCASAGAKSAGLHLTTPKVDAPGTFTDGSASYTNSMGAGWSTGFDPYKIVITKLGPPGGVIEGTFTLSVTGPTDSMKKLTGTFHVCRVADQNAP